MKKKLFCIALSVLFVFTGTAVCSCNGDKPDDSYIKNTDIVLFDEGKTDYKIVIPANPSDSEAFAAEEAACFMKLSSGADFEIVSDKDRNFNENDKVISVGNTSLLKGSGLEIKKSEMGDSGFIIKRFGNTVIIAGANEGYGYGNIYGVYEFLRYEIGYEVYAADEIKVSGEKKGFVKDFDYSYVPTFNERSITEYVLEKDYVYRTRMKLVSPFTSEFGLWGHSNALYILPYSVYGAKHPAWYTATGDVNGRYQLCFTNKEMRAEYVKRLKEIIDEKPDSKYFMLGHEDTSLYCNCEKCFAEIEKYNKRIEDILKSSPFPIIISRLSDDKIIMANNNAIKLFGIPGNLPGIFLSPINSESEANPRLGEAFLKVCILKSFLVELVYGKRVSMLHVS